MGPGDTEEICYRDVKNPIAREEIQSVLLDRILPSPAEAYLGESFADILMICCRPCGLLCRIYADLDFSDQYCNEMINYMAGDTE